jgi:branched-chain amino acid transport system permease protein
MRGTITADDALVDAPVAPARRGATLRFPGLTRRRVIIGGVLLGLGFIPVVVDGAQNVNFWEYIGAYIAGWAMLELSVVVVTGYGGLISLMPFTFVGIGCFSAGVAVSVWGWPFWLAVPFAAAATVPISIAVGAASVRLKGLYLAIATLAFAQALGETLFKWDAFTGGQAGHEIAPPKLGPLDFSSPFAFYALTMVVALLLVWMVHGLKGSRAGRAMLAVRDNEREAQALGINPTKTKLTALVIGGALAGVGGAFYLALLGAPAPAGFQSPLVDVSSVLLVVWAVVGGIESAFGAFLGALALIAQQQIFSGADKLFVYLGVYAAVVLVVFLISRPGGFVQVVKIQTERIRARPVRGSIETFMLVAFNVLVIWLIIVFGTSSTQVGVK